LDMKVIEEHIPPALRTLAEQGDAQALPKAVQALLGEVPKLQVVQRAAPADLEKEKQILLNKLAGESQWLALVVIHQDAVQLAAGKQEFGSYDLFVREKLDNRLEGEIKSAAKESIIMARAKALGMDPKEVERLNDVPTVKSTHVSNLGEKKDQQEVAAAMIPFAFMFLIFVSVLTSSQYLMTSTIEEKSSRIAEVLLSAVSPMELMAGKIIGQFVVGLFVLVIYLGLGLVALLSFAMLGFVDGWLIFYLFFFYLVSFFTYASLMAAVGAAVNEIREAQSLVMPVMITLMLPMLLWMPISRDPGTPLALALSMVPPVNSFFMLIRMASSTPPPVWQIWTSLILGAAAAYGAVWFAAKVFRVGLLMHGKPPNFRTLVRWVRMA
jgi:ABC-2 type transport system permease protein